MSIQGNINQTLGIGAALLSQTGVAAANKEKVAINREQKSLTKSAKALNEVSAAAETDTAAAKYVQSINAIIARKYQLALQSGNAKGVDEALGLISEMEDVNADFANARANTKVNSKQQQKQRINQKTRGGKNANN